MSTLFVMSTRLLAHRILGSGSRTTFLLHGLLGSKRNLSVLARDLAAADADRQVVLADLTGHGESPPLPLAANLSHMAEDVSTLARYLDIELPFEIIGHSLGGRVALKTLSRNPDQIESVTLLDIAPGPLPSSLAGEQVMDHLREAEESFPSRRAASNFFISRGLTRHLANWMALNLVTKPGDGVVWRVDREAIADFHDRQRVEDLWPVVEEPDRRVRLTCIRGGASDYVTDTDMERMRASGVQVETLAGAGHFLHVDCLSGLIDLLQPSPPK